MKRGAFAVLGVLGAALGGVVYLALREEDAPAEGYAGLSEVEKLMLDANDLTKMRSKEVLEQVNQANRVSPEAADPERAPTLQELEAQGIIYRVENKIYYRDRSRLTPEIRRVVGEYLCNRAVNFYGVSADQLKPCINTLAQGDFYKADMGEHSRFSLEVGLLSKPVNQKSR